MRRSGPNRDWPTERQDLSRRESEEVRRKSGTGRTKPETETRAIQRETVSDANIGAAKTSERRRSKRMMREKSVMDAPASEVVGERCRLDETERGAGGSAER